MTPLESFRAKLGAYVDGFESLTKAAASLGITRPRINPLRNGPGAPSQKVLHRVKHKIGLTDAEVTALMKMESERLSMLGAGMGCVPKTMHPHDALLRRWAR